MTIYGLICAVSVSVYMCTVLLAQDLLSYHGGFLELVVYVITPAHDAPVKTNARIQCSEL